VTGTAGGPRRNSFRLAGLAVKPPLLLAPMADLSNYAFRNTVRAYGGCGLCYSEMLNSRRLPLEPDSSPIFKGFGREERLALQVLGDDPDLLTRSVRRLEAFQPAAYDWNLGCTRAKITRWGWGAGLLNAPAKVATALAALRRATTRPLTVKIRIPENASDDGLRAFVTMLESEGADGVIVHARTTEKRFSRPAKWDYITRIKSWLRVPVIGNGDIRTAEDALAMFDQTGCDGIMIGRGAAARPYLFRDIAACLEGKLAPEPPAAEAVLEQIISNFEGDLDTPDRAREFKTFCQYFAEGLPVPHWFWGPLQSLDRGDRLVAKAREFFARRE